MSDKAYANDAGEAEFDPMFGQFALLPDMLVSLTECRTAWCTVLCCARCDAASAGLPAASANATTLTAIGTLEAIKGTLVSLACLQCTQ
jgi:hypothetical protein